MKAFKKLLACALALVMVLSVPFASAAEGGLADLAVGGSTEVGMYTVTNFGNDVWHVEDCTEANPRGFQLDETGAMVGMNNCSDMYVVLGEEKAMLVDLSNQYSDGYADITAIFDELAGEREQIIWITHAHPDHVGQFPAFKEAGYTVYITVDDYDGLDAYVRLGMDKTLVTPIGYDENIDLGGRTFEIVHVPGHTDGSNVLYEVETKIGFSADSVGSGSGVWLFGEFEELEVGLANLLEVIDTELGGEVTLYGGHTWQQQNATLGYVEMDRQYVADMATLIENIKTGGEYTMSYLGYSNPSLDTNFTYGKATITVAKYKAVKLALDNGTVLNPFVDIEDEATVEAVARLYAAGLIKGTGYDTYEPGKTLDRAEFMTMLGRIIGAVVDQNADTGFTDVINDGWSQGYIAWGVDNGLIEGYGDGTFGQYDTLTKEHVNTIVGRFNEKYGVALGGLTPFAEAEGDATRAEIAVMLSAVLANPNYKAMLRMMLPKTQAKYLNPNDFSGWGAFPEDDDYVQGLSASRNPNMDTALELYDVLTYENKDKDDHELAQSITYYVHDPIKHGADPNGKYPVQVWFHGAGNAIDGSGAVGASGALLFATEEYQELMGTPVYVIVPLANEYRNERGGNEGTWLTNTEDGSTSVYTKVLGDLVSDFMAEHADTVSTLHINGTSAGGYMAWRYTMAYSDTIDSTFLMAPALFGIGEEDVDAFLEKTKDFPVLHIHGLHDEMIRYENIVAPFEDKFNAAENYQLVPFEWVRTRDGGVASMMFGIEMGQHCICAQVAEDLKYADGTPMHEDIPNGVTGWYKEILGN